MHSPRSPLNTDIHSRFQWQRTRQHNDMERSDRRCPHLWDKNDIIMTLSFSSPWKWSFFVFFCRRRWSNVKSGVLWGRVSDVGTNIDAWKAIIKGFMVMTSHQIENTMSNLGTTWKHVAIRSCLFFGCYVKCFNLNIFFLEQRLMNRITFTRTITIRFILSMQIYVIN